MPKFNWDIFRKVLPEETFNLLSRPPKDELASLGQKELPFPEEVDFLPKEFVERENIDEAYSQAGQSYLDELFGPRAPEGQESLVAFDPEDTNKAFPLPGGVIRGESLLAPTPAQTWNAPKGADIISRPPTLPEDPAVVDVDPDVVPEGVFNPRIPYTNVPPELTDATTVSGFRTDYGPGNPLPVRKEPGARDTSWWAAMAPDTRITPPEPPRVLADPSMEAAVHYGQDTKALPAGSYQEYPLPGGRGASFVPQDPANQPKPEVPGTPLPRLSDLKRELEDLTGEGVSQTLYPTGAPITGRAKPFADALTERAGIDPSEIQPIWDRISGNHFRDPAGAEREFVKFASAILATGKGRGDLNYSGDPVARMRAHFAQAAPIARGNSNEGFGERVRAQNTSHTYQQIEDYALKEPAQGFRGSASDAEARQDFNPRERPLDVEEDFVVGSQPLQAMTKKPGLSDDPVENFLSGSTDTGVVPRGTLAPGVQRVQGTGAPTEIEVLKVIPLQGNPGYLKDLSKRTGIPLRNLQRMIDSKKPYDIVQVRRPSGKEAKPLPPEGRWRTPESIKFWDDRFGWGERQKAKLEADPEFLEKIIQTPAGRVTRADWGLGKEIFGVVYRKDPADQRVKPHVIVTGAKGKKILKPMVEVGPKDWAYDTGEIDPKTKKPVLKKIPANLLERNALRGKQPQKGVSGGTPPWEELRPTAGTPMGQAPFPEAPGREAFNPPTTTIVKGLEPLPEIRSDLSGVKFALAQPPKSGSWSVRTREDRPLPVTKDPKAADLTVTFTARDKVSPGNPEGFPPENKKRVKGETAKPRLAGERELLDPTPEQLREVLQRYPVNKVAVRVDAGSRRGPDSMVWERAKRVLKAATSGKALALAGAGAAATILGEEEASASPRSAMESFAISKGIRNAEPPPSHAPGMGERLRTRFLDQFDPVYRGVRDLLGLDDTPLRETIQTQYGGGGGQAEAALEPVKLAREQFAGTPLEDDFNAFLTKKAGLRQWDVVGRKRDQYRAEAIAAAANRDFRRERKFGGLAKTLDDHIAGRTVWEQNETKEILSGHLEEIRQRVGDENFRKFEEASQQVYAAVQAELDAIHAAGLLDDRSYQEYKDRGLDHIPTWKAPYTVDAEGNVTYTGGSLYEAPVGTKLEVKDETILKEVMGSLGVMKDPFENVSNFISRATEEVARNTIAKAVVETFAPSGVAKKVNPKPGDRPTLGNSYYTFLEGGKPQVWELPTYLVEPLLMTDKNFARKILQNLPGGKAMSMIRAVPEAAMTTANLGFAASQSAVIDPITALVQVEWANDKVLRNLIPFYTRWAKHLSDGFSREWLGGESSEMRQRAAKAGALYSGAISQVLDPRDLIDSKGFSRAKEAYGRGEYGEALHQGLNATLAYPTKYLMKPFEEATKLATFDLLTSQGVDDVKAAYQTRKFGGSPDWAQSGADDTILRVGVTFGRPALLGIEAGLMAAKRNPKKLATVMAGSLAFEAGRQAFNAMTANELGVSPEELDNRFSDYDKDNTVLFYVPPSIAKRAFGSEEETLSTGITRPFAIKHTIPPVLRLWLSPFKGLAKALRSGNPLEAPLAVADEMLPGTVPLDADNLGDSMVRRVGASLPAPLRAGVEQFADRQMFTGAPIVGSRLEGLPAGEQVSETTRPTFRALGQATGMSPARLDHLAKTFLPGVLETPIQVSDQLLAGNDGVEPVAKGRLEALGDVPFLGPVLARRLTPQRYESQLGDFKKDFYDLANKTKASATAIRKFDQGITGEPSELVQALGGWNPSVTGMVRELSEISTAKKQIVNAPGMSGEEKRDRIKELVDLERSTLKQFLSDPTVQLLLKDQVTQ